MLGARTGPGKGYGSICCVKTSLTSTAPAFNSTAAIHRLKTAGKAVGYQGRKKAHTTTALFLADNRDQPLACASPQAGNDHDNHKLNALFGKSCVFLEAAGIPIAGLFLNADKAFDSPEFR